MAKRRHQHTSNKNYTHKYMQKQPRQYLNIVPTGDSEKDYFNFINEINKVQDEALGIWKGSSKAKLPIWDTEDWFDDDIVGWQHIKPGSDHGNSFGFRVNPNDIVHRWDQHRNYEGAIDKFNAERKKPRPQTWEEYLREIEKLIGAETERLSKFDFIDDNSQFPKMSMNTQRAKQLEDNRNRRQSEKGKSYFTKLQALAARDSNTFGLNNNHTKKILDFLQGEGKKGTNDILKQMLDQEFQDNYKTRGDILNERNDSVLNPVVQDNEAILKNFNPEFIHAQNDIENNLDEAFDQLGKNQDKREQAVIDINKAFGNQQHAHDERIAKGNQKVRYNEALKPYSKLANLQSALSHATLEPGNAQSESNHRANLTQALENYGVDRNATKFEDWDKTRTIKNKPIFSENLTEPLTEPILESQFTAQRVNPKYKGKSYEKLKEIQKDLYAIGEAMDEKNIANVATNEALKRATEFFPSHDRDLKKAMEQRMNQIANKYIRLNQYGSPQQIRESEDAAKDLTEQFAKLRNTDFNKLLETERSREHTRKGDQINKLLRLGRLEDEEFGTMLDQIYSTNARGSENWHNLQGERNKRTNIALEGLERANNIPSLGGRFTEFINTAHKSEAEKKMNDLLKKNPLALMPLSESININDLMEKTLFDENNKATDPYAYNNRGTIKATGDYSRLKQLDETEARNRYGRNKKEEEEKYKRIEDEVLAARKAAMEAQADTNDLDGLSPKDIDTLQTIIGAQRSDYIDKLADLLQEKTKHRFDFYGRNNNKYKPSEHANIRNIAQKYIDEARNVKKWGYQPWR